LVMVEDHAQQDYPQELPHYGDLHDGQPEHPYDWGEQPLVYSTPTQQQCYAEPATAAYGAPPAGFGIPSYSPWQQDQYQTDPL
jgi:hypothetical protein